MFRQKEKSTETQCSLLSYLDSNQDKLIQSQMCYRYTIGHCRFVSSKTGAKVLTFSNMAKFFLAPKARIGN